jgi:hypothetical protein
MSNNYSIWKGNIVINEQPNNSNKKSKKRNMLYGSLTKKEEAELTNIEKKIILKAQIKQTIKIKKELEKELKKIFNLKSKKNNL